MDTQRMQILRKLEKVGDHDWPDRDDLQDDLNVIARGLIDVLNQLDILTKRVDAIARRL